MRALGTRAKGARRHNIFKHLSPMDVAEFDFDLPRELIAGHPVSPRDAARMLHVGPVLADRGVADLPDILKAGDLLVVNDTRVIPARLRGRRGDAKVEVTLHKAQGPVRWRAFARPAKRLKVGDRVEFSANETGDTETEFAATVSDKGEGGEVGLEFDVSPDRMIPLLEAHGEMPLPPYIQRQSGATRADRSDYQTIYARRDGAVAAPTAGLHFTDQLFDRLEAAGIRRVSLTLHVGAGTFLPVKAEKVEDHVMHSEWGEIDTAAAEEIAAARAAGGRIIAVGTTSLRLLESAATGNGGVRPFIGDTDIFITPGYRITTADLLLTNFHLPRSTLFMLVSAFAGTNRMKAAYRHAIAERYRFYSYGDACLLERGT